MVLSVSASGGPPQYPRPAALFRRGAHVRCSGVPAYAVRDTVWLSPDVRRWTRTEDTEQVESSNDPRQSEHHGDAEGRRAGNEFERVHHDACDEDEHTDPASDPEKGSQSLHLAVTSKEAAGDDRSDTDEQSTEVHPRLERGVEKNRDAHRRSYSQDRSDACQPARDRPAPTGAAAAHRAQDHGCAQQYRRRPGQAVEAEAACVGDDAVPEVVLVLRHRPKRLEHFEGAVQGPEHARHQSGCTQPRAEAGFVHSQLDLARLGRLDAHRGRTPERSIRGVAAECATDVGPTQHGVASAPQVYTTVARLELGHTREVIRRRVERQHQLC